MIRLAKRLLRLGALGILAILLSLSAVLLWLTGTQQGLHFLLHKAAPYGVTVQQATGRLLWGVDLQGMQLDLGNTTVATGHLRLRWRPWQFPVLGTLAIDSLVTEDLTIETMPTPTSPP
jgi:autotransporter translocation and assembly factor TamB